MTKMRWVQLESEWASWKIQEFSQKTPKTDKEIEDAREKLGIQRLEIEVTISAIVSKDKNNKLKKGDICKEWRQIS